MVEHGRTVVHALVQASSHSLSIFRCDNLVIQPAMSVARSKVDLGDFSKDYFHHDQTKFASGFSKLNMSVSVQKNHLSLVITNLVLKLKHLTVPIIHLTNPLIVELVAVAAKVVSMSICSIRIFLFLLYIRFISLL